jgi:preprotein translocase subunit SecE
MGRHHFSVFMASSFSMLFFIISKVSFPSEAELLTDTRNVFCMELGNNNAFNSGPGG